MTGDSLLREHQLMFDCIKQVPTETLLRFTLLVSEVYTSFDDMNPWVSTRVLAKAYDKSSSKLQNKKNGGWGKKR